MAKATDVKLPIKLASNEKLAGKKDTKYLKYGVEYLVMDTLKEYGKKLRDFKNNNVAKYREMMQNLYGGRIRQQLEANIIPNKKVTVVVSNDEAVLAFSGGDSPGMMSYYYNENKDYVFEVDNKKLGKIAVDNKPDGKQSLSSERKKFNEKMDEFNSKFDNAIKRSELEKDIEDRYVHSRGGAPDERLKKESKKLAKYLVEKLEHHIKAECGEIPVLRDFDENKRLQALANFLNEYSKQKGNDNVTSLSKVLSTQSKLFQEIIKAVETAKQAPFEFWGSENCAEPHAVTAFDNRKDKFSKGIVKKTPAKAAEGDYYMFTFDIPTINFAERFPSTIKLKPKTRCNQCAQTITPKIKVFTDGKTEADDITVLVPDEARNKRSVYYEPAGLSTDSTNYITTDPAASNSINHHVENLNHYIIKDSLSGTDEWIAWLKNSSKSLLNSTGDTTQGAPSDSIISQYGAQLDTNGTLLLLDLVVRNFTGKSFVSSTDYVKLTSFEEILGHATSIVSQFEDLLAKVVEKSAIPMENLDFDPLEAQKMIIDDLRNGRSSKISSTLYLYVVRANPEYGRDSRFLMNLKHSLKEAFDTENTTKSMPVQ